MVGLQILDLPIGVRVPASQPIPHFRSPGQPVERFNPNNRTDLRAGCRPTPAPIVASSTPAGVVSLTASGGVHERYLRLQRTRGIGHGRDLRSGMGLASARAFAHAGATVILADVSETALRQAVEETIPRLGAKEG